MKISVTTNVRDVIDELNAAAAKARPAVVSALNKTIAQVKVRAAREVRAAGYKLKISDIKDAIKVNKASSGKLRATAVASGRPIPLVKYNARQVGAGVSVDVLNGRKTIAHAFLATTKNGSQQVFLRDPGAKHIKIVKNGKAVWSSLPIRKLFGPSIPDALANQAVARAMEALINEKFPMILQDELNWRIKGMPRRSAVPTE